MGYHTKLDYGKETLERQLEKAKKRNSIQALKTASIRLNCLGLAFYNRNKRKCIQGQTEG